MINTNITWIFLIWALAIFITVYFGFFNIYHSGLFSNNFFDNFANWDGGHYTKIAQFGYFNDSEYAFFPLYPLLISLLSKITNNYILSALLISVSASFLATHILYKLLRLDLDKKIAEKAILFLLMFPTSFFFLTAYTESLFFAFVVSTFYFARREKWLIASVFASLACATRLVGIAVVLALLIEACGKKGNERKIVLFIAPLGFLIYCLYLFNVKGDPFYFLSAELHWQRHLSIPGVGFWNSLQRVAGSRFADAQALFDILFAIFGLGIAIRCWRFLRPSYAIYATVSILMPLFSPMLTSQARFLLPIFPIFILLAQIKNEKLILIYRVLSILLLGAFAVSFICGYWAG